jgi:hypothetical protein
MGFEPKTFCMASSTCGVLSLAQDLVGLLDQVRAPARFTEDYLPEQLSFSAIASELPLLRRTRADERDVPAAHLARALFEESARWSWVEEDPAGRREAFLGEAACAYRLISQAAEAQGIDATPLFGPLVDERLLPAAEGAQRFASRFEELLDWTQPGLREMLYLQYRLMSQYTHSSLLSAASTSRLTTEALANLERLPLAAPFMVMRNGCASVGFVLDFCKAGLEWPQHPQSRTSIFRPSESRPRSQRSPSPSPPKCVADERQASHWAG